jgi:hypothetical protein
MKGNKTKTSHESWNSLGGDPLPGHPKGSRVTTRKRKANASPGGDEDETPRRVPFLDLMSVFSYFLMVIFTKFLPFLNLQF